MVHGAFDFPPPPRLKRWTKREYNELTAQGAFEGQHIYLFRGELIEMAPQFHPHAFTITRLNTALFKLFGLDRGYDIRIQLPFETPGESIPEPDALICTSEQLKRHPHPNRAELVIEVADSSLKEDREKAIEYAAAQVPEYWIIDVKARRLIVHRSPLAEPATALGWRYASIESIDEMSPITPVVLQTGSFILNSVLPAIP